MGTTSKKRPVTCTVPATPRSWLIQLAGRKLHIRSLPSLLITSLDCSGLQGHMMWNTVYPPTALRTRALEPQPGTPSVQVSIFMTSSQVPSPESASYWHLARAWGELREHLEGNQNVRPSLADRLTWKISSMSLTMMIPCYKLH